MDGPVTKITTLENGLRVATETTNKPISSIGVFVNAGSAYENDSNNGTSNFIQHLSLKGTETRSHSQIINEVESLGSEVNSHTSREQMSYIARTANKSNIPKLVDLLGDIIQNPKFDPSDIESTRKTILKEKEIIETSFEQTILDFIHAAAFQGYPLSNPIIGNTESINKIQRDDLIEYMRNHFVSPRMVIAASGQVEHDEFVNLVQKSFNKIPRESNLDISNISDVDYIGSEITVNDNTMNKVYAAIAFQGPSWSNPDFIPLLIIKDFIGSYNRTYGGGNSLVPNLSELSHDRNLCDSYTSFMLPYNVTGLFGIYFESQYDRVDDFSRLMMQEIARVRGMTEFELEIAKMRVRASYLLQCDREDPIDDIGRQVLSLGRKMSAAEFLKRIDDITLKDIRNAYESYLHDVDPVVAAYGNLKYYPDYNNFRSWTT